MGNSSPTPEHMIKKLEYDTIDKKKALTAKEGILKNRFSLKWTERQICKKRTGVSEKNFDSFLEEFKENNYLEESDVRILRDLKRVKTIEDKVKIFVYDCNGGFSYGMVAAAKTSEGPTKEFRPFNIQTEFDKSLENFKQITLGFGERKVYKRREGICKQFFKEFLKNFEEQITASQQLIQKLYEVNLEADIPYKDEFFIADSDYSGRFGMVFLTNVNGNINLTYIQYDVIVPHHALQCQNVFQTVRCKMSESGLKTDTNKWLKKNQSHGTIRIIQEPSVNEEVQKGRDLYKHATQRYPVAQPSTENNLAGRNLPYPNHTIAEGFQLGLETIKSCMRSLEAYFSTSRFNNTAHVKESSMEQLPSDVQSYVRLRCFEVLKEEGFVKSIHSKTPTPVKSYENIWERVESQWL